MEWVIILLILLVAFGPVMWLMPTRKDRRLAGLRQRAKQEGLDVDIRRLPKLNPDPEDRVTPGGRPLPLVRECAAYSRPLPRKLRHHPAWRLMRGRAGEDGLPGLPGWVFEYRRKPDHPRLPAQLEALAPLFEDLPAVVIAVELEPRGLAFYWLEGPGTGPDRVAELAERVKCGTGILEALETGGGQQQAEGNI